MLAKRKKNICINKAVWGYTLLMSIQEKQIPKQSVFQSLWTAQWKGTQNVLSNWLIQEQLILRQQEDNMFSKATFYYFKLLNYFSTYLGDNTLLSLNGLGFPELFCQTLNIIYLSEYLPSKTETVGRKPVFVKECIVLSKDVSSVIL